MIFELLKYSQTYINHIFQNHIMKKSNKTALPTSNGEAINYTQDVYNLEQLALKSSFTDRYLRDAIKKGELTAYLRGRRLFVLHSDYVKFLTANIAKTDFDALS